MKPPSLELTSTSVCGLVSPLCFIPRVLRHYLYKLILPTKQFSLQFITDSVLVKVSSDFLWPDPTGMSVFIS